MKLFSAITTALPVTTLSVTLALTLTAMPAQAYDNPNDIFGPPVKISVLTITPSHNGAFIMLDETVNGTGCAVNSSLFIDKNGPFFNELYSMALTARTADLAVKFHILNGASHCSAKGYPVIQQIWL